LFGVVFSIEARTQHCQFFHTRSRETTVETREAPNGESWNLHQTERVGICPKRATAPLEPVKLIRLPLFAKLCQQNGVITSMRIMLFVLWQHVSVSDKLHRPLFKMKPDLGTQWWSGLDYADLALKKYSR
jgi:hypothetical protein